MNQLILTMKSLICAAIAFSCLAISSARTTRHQALPSTKSLNSSPSETFAVQNVTRNSEGACVCQIHSPEAIQCNTDTSPKTAIRINQLETEISLLSDSFNQRITDMEGQDNEIAALTEAMSTTMEKLEQIQEGNLIVSQSEYQTLRLEIANLEAVLQVLKQNRTKLNAGMAIVEAEIHNITTVVDSLEESLGGDTDRLLGEILDLKQQLLFRQTAITGYETGGPFETWYYGGHQDTCQKLEWVSEPYTLLDNRYYLGTWFRDPVEAKDKVYYFAIENARYQDFLYIYPSLVDFKNGANELELVLPESAEGTGMVAYNGNLYFQVYNTLSIAKYSIAQQSIISVLLPSDTRTNSYGEYLSGRYSYIDFAVDESGLWVIYSRSSSNDVMIISKVDPETLAFTGTWVTSVPKTTVGNCFVVCQVLYCTESYNSHSNKINYYYDTKTSTESILDVPIDDKFLANYALSYNPFDQNLYGWDNGHQVIYKLTFEKAPQ